MADLGSVLGSSGIGGAIGKAIVTLELSTSKYMAEMKAAEAQTVGSTKAMSSGLSTLGTAGVASIGILGVAAVKLALDFDKSLTRIAAISNTSAGAIEGMKAEVLELAGQTAQSPTELADALFFLASAGLDASEVMPALEASAKASAVGLGTTADVANIVASALNAYSGSSLTAAKATDILVAAVREGRAEPEEFANALGRILPIASTVGVAFDQVAASMASLSNIGLDVNEATTAMRGVLQALAAPGKQASEALSDIGLSAQQLLDAMREDGIVSAIRLLDEAVKANTSTDAEYNGVLRQIIPNVRSLTGVLGLTTQEAAKVDAIFQRVLESQGATDDAFRTTAESSAFQLQKALNDLVVTLTDLGGNALPLVAGVARVVAENLGAIATVLVGLAAAKIIPALLGAIATALLHLAAAASSTALLNLSGTFASMAAGAGPWIAAAALALAGAMALTEAFDGLQDKMDELGDAFAEGEISAKNYAITALSMLPDFAEEDLRLQIKAALLHQVSEEYRAGTIDLEQYNARQAEINATFALSNEEIDRQAAGLEELTGVQGAYVAGAAPVVGANEKIAESQRKQARATEKQAEAMKEFRQGVVDSIRGTVGEFETLNDAFATTPAELQKQMRLTLQIARRDLRNLRTIWSDADLTRDQKIALAEMEPAARDACARAGEAGRRQIASDAVKIKNATTQSFRQATRGAVPVAEEGGKTIGRATTEGAATGVREGSGFSDAVVAMVKEGLAAGRAAAGAQSPSKVMHELGLDMTEGLWRGISDGAQKVIDTERKLVQKLIDGLKKDLDKVKGLAQSFADSIKGAFAGFLDVGGIWSKEMDAFASAQDKYADDQAKFTEDQKKYLDDQAKYLQDQAKYMADYANYQLALSHRSGDMPYPTPPGAPTAPTAPTGPTAPGGAPDLSTIIQAQVSAAQDMAEVLRKLQRQGAGKQLLAEVAEQGIEFGQALLAGGKPQITEANKALADIAKMANLTGKGLSEEFFGKKIDKVEAKLDKQNELMKDLIAIERLGHEHAIILDGEVVSTTNERGLTRILNRKGSLFDGAVKK